MKNRFVKKLIQYLVFVIIFITLVFLCGFFAPREYLLYHGAIITALITIFGVSITLYTFIQGLIQNLKESLSKSFIKSATIKDYKHKIDKINKELRGDVKVSLFSTLIYILFCLFFDQISNDVWQTILVYIYYSCLVSILFAILDLAFTMFKLVEISAFVNNELLQEKSLTSNQDEDI